MDVKEILTLWRGEYLKSDQSIQDIKKISECCKKNTGFSNSISLYGSGELDAFCMYKLLSDYFCIDFVNHVDPNILLVHSVLYNIIELNISKTVDNFGIFQDIILSRGITKIALSPDIYYVSKYSKILIALDHYSWKPDKILSYTAHSSSKYGKPYLIFSHNSLLQEDEEEKRVD